MFLTYRIKGVPVTFLMVVAMTIFLTIFFGAWAVSADVDARDRSLSFGFATNSPGFGLGASDLPQTLKQGNTSPTTTLRTGIGEPERGESTGHSWWGSALLKACPLH